LVVSKQPGDRMSFDLVLRNARIRASSAELVDIGVIDGRIAAIGPGLAAGGDEEHVAGNVVLPGLVETHIHLDKSCIIDRCQIVEGTLKEAIAETAKAKAGFTEEDIEARARRTLEKSILAGTQFMRSHVEVDPRIGLKSFHALSRLKLDYQWALDIQICVFPQEGLTNDPGTEELLVAACRQGADLIGGCPYTDTDPTTHINRIFRIARDFDIDIDFHLDFDLDPSWMHLGEVLRQTEMHRYGGRVAVGHVTKLSAIPPDEQIQLARRLANAGIALTILPATDLFLTGRDIDYNVPRGVTRADRFHAHGVTCSLATNNVLNPFTPFGDASLVRMANLYANIAQLGRPADLLTCLDMITGSAARLMNLDGYGIDVGNPADLIVAPCSSIGDVVSEIVRPTLGLKRGRRSFIDAPGRLLSEPSRTVRSAL
jgi:cytosine/creatinine deaminase